MVPSSTTFLYIKTVLKLTTAPPHTTCEQQQEDHPFSKSKYRIESTTKRRQGCCTGNVLFVTTLCGKCGHKLCKECPGIVLG